MVLISPAITAMKAMVFVVTGTVLRILCVFLLGIADL